MCARALRLLQLLAFSLRDRELHACACLLQPACDTPHTRSQLAPFSEISHRNITAVSDEFFTAASLPALEELTLTQFRLAAAQLRPGAGDEADAPLPPGQQQQQPLPAGLGTAAAPALRRLSLHRCCLPDDAIALLAAAPWAGGLEELDVTGSEVSLDGVTALLRAPLESLKALKLSALDLPGEFLTHLAHAAGGSGGRHWAAARLTQLELTANYRLGADPGPWELLAAAPLRTLRCLVLGRGIVLAAPAAAALGRAQWLGSLEQLVLAAEHEGAPEEAAMWRALRRAAAFRGLEAAGRIVAK